MADIPSFFRRIQKHDGRRQHTIIRRNSRLIHVIYRKESQTMSDGNPYTNQIEEVEIQKLLEKLEQIDPPDISTEDLDPVVARANALGAAGWQIVHGSGLNPGRKGDFTIGVRFWLSGNVFRTI